jgi:hypothetical protein
MPRIPISIYLYPVACWLLLLSGCAGQAVQQPKLDPHAAFTSTPLDSPVPANVIEQRLVSSPNGKLFANWWSNTPNSADNLMITALEDGKWSAPKAITGMAGIVDAQVVPIGNDKLAAMWMVGKPAPNGEGEVHDIYLANSDSSGKQWGKPLRINQEAMSSMKESPAIAALGDGSLMAAWIDMRNLKMTPPKKPGEEMGMEGFTSLYVARVSPDIAKSSEMLVDKEFCECCGPAITSDGNDGLLSYRDLKPENIRDPAFMRVSQNSFSQPSVVHNDHWKIDACPSKGPAITRFADTVGVTWLTSVNDKLIIRTAFSSDKGKHFAAPVDLELDAAASVSAIEMENPHSALVAWTTTGSKGEMLKLARVFDDERIEHRTTVHALTNGGAYKWPGPRMVKVDGSVIFAWNDEQGKKLGLIKVKVDD